MEIILSLINKTLFIGMILSILVVLRHIFLFYRNMIDIEPKRYSLTKSELLYLGISVSYIIMSIINGIAI